MKKHEKSLDSVLLYWMIVLLLVRNWTTQNSFLNPPKSRVTILEFINPYFCKFCEAGKVKRITHVKYNFNFRNGLIPLCSLLSLFFQFAFASTWEASWETNNFVFFIFFAKVFEKPFYLLHKNVSKIWIAVFSKQSYLLLLFLNIK